MLTLNTSDRKDYEINKKSSFITAQNVSKDSTF
jgi:hypothetical protein